LGIEVYRGRLILYGCGDLINDYEGIGGHEAYRPDLGIMYLVKADPEAGVIEVEMIPMQMRRFRLCLPDATDREWIAQRLTREGERFGTAVSMEGSSLFLRW
jgi:poly-gamma-glutamate synthesis protein (capsule biosynthesis protein)